MESEEKRSEALFPQTTRPIHPSSAPLLSSPLLSSPTWRVPLGAGFQLQGQAGHQKGAGHEGQQAVAFSGVGAWWAPVTEREKASLGEHIMLFTSDTLMLGSTSLRGGTLGHLCLQTNLSPLKMPPAYVASGTKGILPPAPQPWVGGEAVPFSPPTVTFGRLTTGSAGRGRVGGLGRSASSA